MHIYIYILYIGTLGIVPIHRLKALIANINYTGRGYTVALSDGAHVYLKCIKYGVTIYKYTLNIVYINSDIGTDIVQFIS